MESKSLGKSRVRVAVVGVGYWGKNLVRNFHDLGALEVLCDADATASKRPTSSRYQGIRFQSNSCQAAGRPIRQCGRPGHAGGDSL